MDQRKNDEVIIERIKNLSDLVQRQHKENGEEHINITDRLDFTNGKVRKGELWRHSTIAMGSIITAVVIPLILYIAWDTKNDMEEYKDSHVETAAEVRELINKVNVVEALH